MKKILPALLVLSISTLFACKKNKEERSQYPFINLNDCISKTYAHDKVNLCFEEVIADTRCPEGMFCVWEGAAIAKFIFTKDNNNHLLALCTNALNLPVSKDTVVDGYRVEFVDLKPYPKHFRIPERTYRAEVKITKL
jgi:hypothetical protein